MSGTSVKFSLVLCTVGRRDEIGAFCASLVRQQRDDVELILVDQNADDRLDAIVAEYAGRFPLHFVKSDTRGLSRARNVGLQHVSGELVGFPDDDCEYFDGYLDRVADLFDNDPALGGLTGYPTAAATRTLPDDWPTGAMVLTRERVLNRCQEFTIFVRRSVMRGIKFNDHLGVGAGTPWGADEGPDFLIRVVEGGARVVFYPQLFVYHPDKILSITPQTLQRAASYARGRGAYFRLHPHPLPIVARGVLRPAGGAVLYALRLNFGRARYYASIVRGLIRGLTMSRAELETLKRSPPTIESSTTAPVGKVSAHA